MDKIRQLGIRLKRTGERIKDGKGAQEPFGQMEHRVQEEHFLGMQDCYYKEKS